MTGVRLGQLCDNLCGVLQLPGEALRLQLEAFSDPGEVTQKKSESTFKSTKLGLKSEDRHPHFSSYLVTNDLNINLKVFVRFLQLDKQDRL